MCSQITIEGAAREQRDQVDLNLIRLWVSKLSGAWIISEQRPSFQAACDDGNSLHSNKSELQKACEED